MTNVFYRDVSGAVLVFDITKHEHFASLDRWLQEINNNTAEQIPIILVGNKIDQIAQRNVTSKEALDYVAKNNLVEYVETSAKTSENVVYAFHTLLSHIIFGPKKPLDGKSKKEIKRRALERESSIKLGSGHPRRAYHQPVTGSSHRDRRSHSSKCSC